MRVVITSGPSYEPIDQVRRLSNFSTGELGSLLAETFAKVGHEVTLFRGVGSTFPAPTGSMEVISFTTNDSLAAGLTKLPAREGMTAVFHAAALSDFRVKEITDENGHTVSAGKISSRVGELKLTLEPASKLLPTLRRMFPASILVGWKYELDGKLADVLAKGRQQIDACLTDACVLNGAAYGPGFGVVPRAGDQVHLPDKAALCRFLLEWTESTPIGLAAPRDPSFHALSSFTSLSPFI